jgi:hypothetical protein
VEVLRNAIFANTVTAIEVVTVFFSP